MAGCGGPNGLPPGVNLGGAIGGGFVQPERLPELNHHDYYRGSLEWSYQPPSRLASAFTPSHEVMLRSDLSEIVPKPEPLFKPYQFELHLDLDPQFTLTGVIKSKPTRSWERKDPELDLAVDYSAFPDMVRAGLVRPRR